MWDIVKSIEFHGPRSERYRKLRIKSLISSTKCQFIAQGFVAGPAVDVFSLERVSIYL